MGIPLPPPFRPRGRGVGERARVAWWSALLPLTLLIASLFAVVFILFVMSRVSRGERATIAQVNGAARSELYDLQRILALEMSAQRAYQFAHDPQALRDYDAERAEEERVFARLHPLVLRIGPRAAEALQRLRSRTQAWQHAVEEIPPRPLPAARLDERLSLQGTLYSRVLAAAADLESVVQRSTEQRRARVARYEHVELQLVVVLVALALGAVVMLVRVGTRLRQLTDRAHGLAERSRLRQEELERLANEKERFIRGVTHDLKNPLGAVDAYAQLLEAEIRGPLNDSQRDFVARIRRATQETLATIQELLELARAESVRMRIDRRSTDAARVVTETAGDYRASLEAAGLQLRVELAADLPSIHTDESRMREILGNLLSNALKYTPSGGEVVVEAVVRSGGPLAPDDALVVSVTDDGPGIPEEDQERIFGEFERGVGAASGGAGLGLAISRRMARLLGGELTLRSRPGDGSTFSLWLPLSGPPAPDVDRQMQEG
ncbi:MAG TPA: HAMP domain-containing sensor histidine kinase [Longimicrobiaceae bacterium]|nr:HAMP domain-containing sensor histidine kinase [Longimicrobiaceae bacterium]